MKYMNIKLFTVISTLIVSSSTYSSSLSKCLSTMTGEPGKPGPMGIYKPGFNTYTTKQNNLTFGGKTYSTYMDLCKDIKDDKEKIVGFLKQKDQELKKYQDSDVDYKKRKIEHEKAEADYRAQQEFRDTERAAMSEYHQALEDGSVNEEYAQERMKSKIEAADAELKAKQDLNSQYYEIDQDSLDKTLTERFGQERKPGDTLENTVGTDFRNEQRNDIQAKILGFGDADASNFGDNSDDNNDLTDENSPLTAPRTPEQICQDEENRGNNVEEGDIKVTCTTDGKVQKDSPTPDTNIQGENLQQKCAQKVNELNEVTEKVIKKYPDHVEEFEAHVVGDSTLVQDNQGCMTDDEVQLNKDITIISNMISRAQSFVPSKKETENDIKCDILTEEEKIACNEKDSNLIPNYNAIVKECKNNVQSNEKEKIDKNLKELSTIKSKCSTTTNTADVNTAPNSGVDRDNPCSNNLTISCTSDQITSTCISSDEVIGNKESCSYDKNQKTVKIKVRNSQEEYQFSLNGTNLEAKNTNFGNFNTSEQAMQYLIGYNINQEGNLRGHYNNIIKDEITEVPYPGGFTNFTQCQKAAGLDSWKELIKNETQRKKMVEAMSKAHFYDNLMRAASANCDLDITETGRNANICIGTLVTNDSSIVNRVYANAVSKGAECEVIARVIKENFDDNKHQDSEYRDGGQTASMDGRLKCSVSNIQTIDYDECKNIVNAYNAALIGKQGLTVVQQDQTQEATFDGNQRMQEAQINAVNNIRNGTDTNNPMQRQVNGQMAAYEVQKDMINKQKSQAQTRAAIDTAAAASLVGLAQALPDKNYLVDKCENTFKSSTVLQDARKDLVTIRGQFSNAINDEQTYKERDMKYYCQDKIASMDHDFIPNKLISQPVYAIAAEFGVEAAKNQLSASMLKKRAGMIDDLMERIKNMDTGGEYAGLTQQEAIMKYCEANPSSPQCAALPGGTGTTVINPGGFNLGGEDFAANGLEDYNVEDFGEDLDTVSEIDENGDGDGSTGPTSTKVADVNKNGEKGAIAPRAKIGNGGGRGPASGGGAGGAASAGNRGGGGAPEGEKGKGQASGQAKNTSLAYNSGKNNAYLKGGGSINSRSNKKVANPFAKLFKNSKGKVLNFRGPSSIGKQSGNLFTRISKRYGNVHENNRLLKYKYTPAK